MTRHVISGSDGINLQFQDDDSYSEYKAELEVLQIKHYKKTRDTHGIWAGNQNKFVSDREHMNSFDSMHMENLLDQYYEV